MTRIKICGLTRREDAELAIASGADAVGFIHEPSSPRYIGEEVPAWINELPPFAVKVAVFHRVDRAPARGTFDRVQGAEWEALPEPFTKRIHVVRLRPGQRADDLVQQTVNAAAIMLDAYRDEAYGGTGHRIDWEVAAEIVRRSVRPVILAGGLNPDNVAEAIRQVRPFAVDASSGLESRPGVKDWAKLKDFIDAARGAG